jgi:hypothetical protein
MDLCRDSRNRGEIARARGSESSFDHIHLEPCQLFGDCDLVIWGECYSWCLLAVAQGGIEDDQPVTHEGVPSFQRSAFSQRLWEPSLSGAI